ncbi:Putative peptide transport system permease protein BRA1092/BS1330_II1084 [Geodia barretti]|uniref:Peptide transport system permease protein BRA1092/BS1330_II1084 n=1 Tax=Geodia barretti TaxID=519541 RepID=A0AA35TH35_GEOBA|nr:Putative peptide transport system permease protein BRA1092/BS1330_II1084 [Geodia barretti]
MLVFALFWIVPGDAAYMILTGGDDDAGKVSLAQLEQLKEELGLNRPIYSQYGHWLWDIMRGDLGTSIWYKIPVWEELENRFYVTIELSLIAIFMAFVVAVPLGVISAVKQDTWGDYSSRVFALIGIATPTFWLGILMVYGLAYTFNWLPPFGVMREDYMRTARAKGLKEMVVIGRHALKNALLPVVTISGYQFASMLGGVIIVESIFVVPGMGTLLMTA